jgi:ketosteroid isomerase-like protein
MPPRSRVHQSLVARFVSRGFAANKRGDLEFLLAAFYDADVEWHGTIGGLDEGSLRRRSSRGEELIVFVHEVARGRQSGVVVETDTATVSTFQDGMIVRVRGFMDQQKPSRPPDWGTSRVLGSTPDRTGAERHMEATPRICCLPSRATHR